MEKSVESIIFDLDGTLVDSLPDMHAASSEMLKSINLNPLPSNQVRSFIGDGVGKLIERCLDVYGLKVSEVTTQVFMEYYYANPTTHSRCYQGVKGALSKLYLRGFNLGICTNKPSSLTNKVLENLDIKQYFEVVICGDTFPERKPNPRPLLEAVSHLKSKTNSTIFIGDSEVDMQTAVSSNVRFGLFSQGYRRGPVTEFICDFHFDKYLELETRLKGYF